MASISTAPAPSEQGPSSGATAATGPDWQFSQCFGDREPQHFVDADTLTAVQFSYDGQHLATGDRGGRVVVFQRQGATGGAADGPGPQYKFYAEFQSHESEFDYLKSMDIEEKINHIAWCRGRAASLALLTTNDKTIKLWRVTERRLRAVSTMNVQRGRFGGQPPIKRLTVPQLTAGERSVVASQRRTFNNAHAYHINSISTCSDGQTFLSADDLRINIWDFERPKSSFNIVDMKPSSMDELMEVITTAQFHPMEAHLFAFGSSQGRVRMADMRQSALCDDGSQQFVDFPGTEEHDSYSALARNIMDVQFSPDGAFIFSRDYLSAKVWDVRKPGTPLHRIPIQEHLSAHLEDMFETECIFDKFRISPCWDGRRFATGTYDDQLLVVDAVAGTEQRLDLNTLAPSASVRRLNAAGTAWSPPARPVSMTDFTKKLLHYTWHPSLDVLAVAGLSSLSLFTSPRSAADASVPVSRETSHSASVASSAGGSFASYSSDQHRPTQIPAGQESKYHVHQGADEDGY